MSCNKMSSPHVEPCDSMSTNGSAQVVTNIYTEKVENMILTNSSVLTNAHYPHSLENRCSVHTHLPVDFLCVPCDADICKLCKMSEHERHETKSISLAAQQAKSVWMSVTSARIKLHKQNIHNIMEETKLHMQDLQQTACATEMKVNQRYEHLQSVISSSESSSLLANIYEQRLLSAQMIRQQKKRSKIMPVKNKLQSGESMPAINLRQKMLLCMMKGQKEQKLEQLTAVRNEASDELAQFVKRMEEELESTAHVQEMVEQAIDENNHIAILNSTRQVQVKFSTELLRNRLSHLTPAFTYTFSHTATDINEDEIISRIFWCDHKEEVETYIENILGHAMKTSVPARKGADAITVDLQPAFCCSEAAQAVVKSICPCGDKMIMVSYTRSPNEIESVTKTFDLNGQELSHPFQLGSLSTMSNSQQGRTIPFLPACSEYGLVPTSVHLSAKHNKHYHLKSTSDKTKCCFEFYLRYKDKNDTVMEALVGKHSSSMNMGTAKAFDVCSSGESFAVVTVSVTNTYNLHGFQDGLRFTRHVLILDKAGDTGLRCYKYEAPKPADFSPTDVCFLNVNGEELLAVSDMGTNSIHLLSWSTYKDCYVFTRHLIDSHSLLKCPTALNTDPQGRLWLACLGGHLLTMELRGS